MGNVKSFCCKDSASDIDDNDEHTRILGNNCDNSCDDLYNNRSNNSPAQSLRDNVSYGSFNECNDKTMEQAVLDKIYQKMASNLIDVAPGESMVIQSAEFTERQRAYQARLNQIKTPLPLKPANRGSKHVNSSLDTTVNISSLSPSTINTHYNSSATTNNTSGTRSSINVSQNLSTTTTTTHNNANNTNDATIFTTTSRGHVANSPQEKRRVEYEPIKNDELRLINEISLKSANAVKKFKIETQEQVVVQFKP